MAIRDLLRKKDKGKDEGASATTVTNSGGESSNQQNAPSSPPEFTFMRSTTTTEEIIKPPSFAGDRTPPQTPTSETSPRRRRVSGLNFRTSKSPTKSTASTNDSDAERPPTSDGRPGHTRRISARLEKFHLSPRNRAISTSSIHVPDDLPAIDKSGMDGAEAEAQWEKRALLLANKNAPTEVTTSAAATRVAFGVDGSSGTSDGVRPARPGVVRAVSTPESDLDIAEAIRLHESGELERATTLFARLASPRGHNNALAQVMYGLSLRHGWGCVSSPTESLKYLSLAASNSAGIESAALSAGSKKGGPAKGELVLAVFELGNSFKYGLGCDKDPIAARRFYETAAELDDTDAMVEVSWCYLEGYGGKKDKIKAAQYLRMAEKKGVREPGNSWIWKEKYNEPAKPS